MTQQAQVIEKWIKVKGQLEKVSPSFCLAKWTQSTLYLHTGFTHSCHHPISHKIDVANILDNPVGLHNTPEKMRFRQEMLNGERPKECDYCWRVEDVPGSHFSDRIQKSSTSWSLPYLDEVVAAGVGKDYQPKYLEVMFENTCNFKCIYCFPDISSRIHEDIEFNGPFKLNDYTYQDLSYLEKVGKVPINRKEHNPYVAAFWEWWPDLYKSVKTFRITGGEPLLSDNTWRILDYIIENPNKDLTLGINTNLGTPDKLIDKFIEKLQKVRPNVKELQVFSSLEATGREAEYIRFGMNNWDFKMNCRRILNETDTLFTIMTTINVLSYSTLTDFIHEMTEFRALAKSNNHFHVSLNFLRYPEFLDIRLLPGKTKEYLTTFLNAMAVALCDYPRASGREDYETRRDVLKVDECENLKRIVVYMNSEMPEKEKHILNLRAYLREQDRRRKTNHEELFPELAEHLNSRDRKW